MTREERLAAITFYRNHNREQFAKVNVCLPESDVDFLLALLTKRDAEINRLKADIDSNREDIAELRRTVLRFEALRKS